MVDYNKFADTFSKSRKNMKWEEIGYFLGLISNYSNQKILDIWCGNWRFLWELISRFNIKSNDYLWVDLSSELLKHASSKYSWFSFKELNMSDLDKLDSKYDFIFFIASFHHLKTLDDRITVLKKAYDLLEPGWEIFMTNWSLDSNFNKDKYSSSKIDWSINKFWSFDYDIKIWNSNRYYHWFSLEELEYLFDNTWFETIENREFENQRNFISIIKRPN